MDLLFPFAEYWWFYFGFTAFVVLLLALDLGVFHRHAHAVTFRESLSWSIVWVALALTFNYAFYLYAVTQGGAERGAQAGLEFLTGYIVEKSLAVDNIFVFVMVFAYFGIPAQYQHRVLFYGIIGALLFRAIFIALGAVLLKYKWIVLIFGFFLIATGIKLIFAPEKPKDPEHNIVLRMLRKWVPLTPKLHGQRFFVKEAGKWVGTPLFVTLAMIEVSDIVFAVDSVPAIFAITNEPFIVYTSNVFAILGLRSLYFLLAGAADKFHMLKYGLGIVLVFVGCKMVTPTAWYPASWDGHFPIVWSLGIICGVIGGSMALSIAYPKKHEPEQASPGPGNPS
jgi:tellurite resistance protein TerC